MGQLKIAERAVHKQPLWWEEYYLRELFIAYSSCLVLRLSGNQQLYVRTYVLSGNIFNLTEINIPA